jgi:hypothetical protein
VLSKNEYSNKDSNRNRMAEERETNRYIYLAIALAASLAGIFFYYNYMLAPTHPIKVPPPPSVESAPRPPWTYKPSEAKPYDVNKPPYEQ